MPTACTSRMRQPSRKRRFEMLPCLEIDSLVFEPLRYARALRLKLSSKRPGASRQGKDLRTRKRKLLFCAFVLKYQKQPTFKGPEVPRKAKARVLGVTSHEGGFEGTITDNFLPCTFLYLLCPAELQPSRLATKRIFNH